MQPFERPPADPELQAWWDRYMNSDAEERIVLARQKLSEDIPADKQEEFFPEAILEAQRGSDPAEYVALLEELAENHRELYDEALQWFLYSRVNHYLCTEQFEKLDRAVQEDAAAMSKTEQPLFATMAMLRLAGRTEAAETLAVAAVRCMDPSDLVPWAQDEVFHWSMDAHLRACIRSGCRPEAFQVMEEELAKLDAVDEEEMVELRRQIALRFAGKVDIHWNEDQLAGTGESAHRNRYRFSYGFAGWLVSSRSLPPTVADELRGLFLPQTPLPLSTEDHPHGMNDAGDVSQNRQKDVQPEMQSEADF